MSKYKVGDIVKDPALDILDHYTAEWIDVGVVRITGIVDQEDTDKDDVKRDPDKDEVKRTERGWAGHLCVSSMCRYHRNTLLEYKDKKIVVSTVGHYVNPDYQIDTIGLNRWYETMCFEGCEEGGYIEADIHNQIPICQEWGIWGSSWNEVLEKYPLVDIEADKMHESIVAEMIEFIQEDSEDGNDD